MTELKQLPFNFEYIPRKNKYLATNMVGDYIYLTEKNLHKLIKSDISKLPDRLIEELRGILIGDEEIIETIIQKLKNVKGFMNTGPSLHMIIVTLECQMGCVYCHASAECNRKDLQMTKETAEKAVRFIMNSKNPNITIEFQGGETLLNWDIVKYIIEKTEEMNKVKNKNIHFALVTNLQAMTEDKLKYFIDHNIGVCTSFDGPKELHDKNRPCGKGSNYDTISFWLKYIQKNHPDFNLPALVTVSRKSLSYPKEIVDTYIDHNLTSLFLRPINPYGRAEKKQKTDYYSPEEYMEFYKKALEYILKINKQGKLLKEHVLYMFLEKLMLKKDNGYVDMCSPCGAGIRALAYDYNGKIYTCDEGRMLAKMGDDKFLLGTVNNEYNDIVNHETVCQTVKASCLEGKPVCHQCVYKPYCGVCPIYNYITQKNIYGHMTTNDRCKLSKLQFEYFFELLDNAENVKIFEKWIGIESQKSKVKSE